MAASFAHCYEMGYRFHHNFGLKWGHLLPATGIERVFFHDFALKYSMFFSLA